jgi:nifR3 family TIM-barrel protein
LKVKNVEIKNPIVLAPLAGYTNRTFRGIVKEFGVGLVYSEMISAHGIIYDNKKTIELTEVNPKEHPLAMQIFGGEVELLTKAAQYIDKYTDADIIDLNMGCPVRKVLKAESGSKLLTDPEKIYRIVSAVVQNVEKPVSVKIRAGWDHSSINADVVAEAIEKAGASLICIHGRTKSDLYRGKVNLDYIKMVKAAVNIPVIGNGDIRSIEDAEKMFAYTGVDMIMIGRGALGNPWLLRDLVCWYEGKKIPAPPTAREKLALCKRHLDLLVEEKGERTAVLEMRSMAAWYVKGIERTREFKQKLNDVKTKTELHQLIDELERERC